MHLRVSYITYDISFGGSFFALVDADAIGLSLQMENADEITKLGMELRERINEMVEIRHDLNQRRQKLREQIKYNTDTKEDYEQHIRKVVEESEFGQEILKEVLDK